MTDVSAVTATTGSAAQDPLATAASRNQLDYDAFLRLLTTQLTNQDPLNPMDNTEYVAQLATFSEVEQSIQTNQMLETLLSANAIAAADGLIGRTLTSGDGAVSGEIVSVQITREGSVAKLAGGEEVPITEGVRIA